MTMIKFLTDGVLIREMMEDPLLTKYRYVRMLEASIAYFVTGKYSTMSDPIVHVTLFDALNIYWLVHNGVKFTFCWEKIH